MFPDFDSTRTYPWSLGMSATTDGTGGVEVVTEPVTPPPAHPVTRMTRATPAAGSVQGGTNFLRLSMLFKVCSRSSDTFSRRPGYAYVTL